MITTLFDLDGFLADFVTGSLAVHGKHIPPDEVRWDFFAQAGLTAEEFWKPLHNREFWAGLDVHTDGMAVFEKVASATPDRDRIGFLTSAACPLSYDGKKDWVAKYLPGWETHIVTAEKKGLAGAKSKCLVDDHDKNVDAFAKAGGQTVLVPRPWNRRRDEALPGGRFDIEKVTAEILLRRHVSVGPLVARGAYYGE